jgi:hypothetical protein
MSSEISCCACTNGTGICSTRASKGVASSKSSTGPFAAWYFRRRVVSTRTFAKTGEPASSPRNSPSCHCRVSIHSASRTCARKARSNLSARGRPSSLFQTVIPGAVFSTMTDARLEVINFPAISPLRQRRRHLVVERQIGRDGQLGKL